MQARRRESERERERKEKEKASGAGLRRTRSHALDNLIKNSNSALRGTPFGLAMKHNFATHCLCCNVICKSCDGENAQIDGADERARKARMTRHRRFVAMQHQQEANSKQMGEREFKETDDSKEWTEARSGKLGLRL